MRKKYIFIGIGVFILLLLGQVSFVAKQKSEGKRVYQISILGLNGETDSYLATDIKEEDHCISFKYMGFNKKICGNYTITEF